MAQLHFRGGLTFKIYCMQGTTANRINNVLQTEVLPTYVNWQDYFFTMSAKLRELDHLRNSDNRKGFYKCAVEVAALSIHLLETLPE